MEKKDNLRKVVNPYDNIEGHYCFACSKKNPFGLKLDFFEEGEDLVSVWNPRTEFTGFHNVLHGGIQATLIDEIAAWCIQIKHKTVGVTAKLEMRYKKPVYCDKGALILRAKIVDIKRNIVKVYVRLYDAEKVLCSEADLQFYTFSQEIAQQKFYYPDYNLFFEEKS